MKYGLIGEKLGHSFSCEIHQKIALYEYELCPLPREELDGFMRKKDFLGNEMICPTVFCVEIAFGSIPGVLSVCYII